MKISRDITIETTVDEDLKILRKWAVKNPQVLRILLDYPRGNCPFPDSCDEFPCERLTCNADVCSNGYTYRMS